MRADRIWRGCDERHYHFCDTLRRDHVGAYSGGHPLDQCWSAEAPAWSVPTPNMDRMIERGTVFDNAYIGSTPCMPARRDIYTGRQNFWSAAGARSKKKTATCRVRCQAWPTARFSGRWNRAIPSAVCSPTTSTCGSRARAIIIWATRALSLCVASSPMRSLPIR